MDFLTSDFWIKFFFQKSHFHIRTDKVPNWRNKTRRQKKSQNTRYTTKIQKQIRKNNPEKNIFFYRWGFSMVFFKPENFEPES